MLEKTIEALKHYQNGADPKVLQPIDQEILRVLGDSAASQALELRLVEVLQGDVPYAAKDVICRMLRIFGSASSVPILTPMLADDELSNMSRYALERIPAMEAGHALLHALPKTSGRTKIGILSSIGVRGESDSVSTLATALTDSDPAVVGAAALALGEIGTQEAAEVMLSSKPHPGAMRSIADGLLACAEKLVATGNPAAATTILQKIASGDYSEPAVSAAKSRL